MPTHTISAGECVVSLAAERGDTVERIWNDPANASLREAREDGRVLAPGDTLTIPERREKWERLATGRRHRLKRVGLEARLRLRFVDEDGKPRADLPWVLEVDGELFSGTTSDEGLVEHPLPATCREATLRLREDKKVEEYLLAPGTLQPASLDEGALQRLEALGLLAPGERREPVVRLAIASVQMQDGEEPSGVLDDETKRRIERRYRAR